MLAVVTAGIAKMIMNDVTSIAHTKSGMRLSDIPGARCLKIVTISSTAPTSATISVKVIVCAQMSARLPGSELRPGERHVRKPADVRAGVQEELRRTETARR